MNHPRPIAAAIFPLATLLLATEPSQAASLQQVQSFGNNPSNARMFLYVPDQVAASPPLLVAIHYCGGTANAYFTGTGYRALSDQYGFIVIYPETTSSDGCWDVHSDATLHHNGGSDSAAIVSMVSYTVAQRAANAGRVYVTGTSSGAMMTNVLLGAYPDVFKAGAAFAGVPYACFAGTSAWSTACAMGQISRTGPAWGDLVRAGYPGYTGARPRMQLWHGTADDTLNFNNFGEAIKQWTNVLGVSETPTSTEQNVPQSGWTRTRYADSSGIVRVEAVREQGQTHNLVVPANEVIRFFGLNGTVDPGGGGGGMGGGGSGGRGGAPNGGSPSGGSPNGGVGTAGGAGIGGLSGGAGSGAGGVTGGAGVATAGLAGAAGNPAPTGGGAGATGTGGGAPAGNGAGATAGSVSAGGSGTAGTGGGTDAASGEAADGGACLACNVGSGQKERGSLSVLLMGLAGALLERRVRQRRS